MWSWHRRVRCFNWSDHNWAITLLVNREIEKHSSILRGQVFDLGRGTQPYRRFIESLGCTYVGVDWEHSYHKPHPDLIADLNQRFPMDAAIADTVLAISILEHLREPGLFLEEAYRILRPGGYLVLQVPFQWPVHEEPFDYFRFTSFGLDHLARKAGFPSPHIHAGTGFWITLVMRANDYLLRGVRGPRAVKWLVRALLVPIWFGDQMLALLLDKLDPTEGHTSSYTLVASKPKL